MNDSNQKLPSRKFEIEIAKESLHFSAAHFTIFGPRHRENLHGHNFQVRAVIEGEIGDDGLTFDYSIIKEMLQDECDHLDEKTLLPKLSPFLQVSESADYVQAKFGNETIPFLPRDVLLLPVRNITVEELSNWFLDRLLCNEVFQGLPIQRIALKVASGSGQWGIAKASLK